MRQNFRLKGYISRQYIWTVRWGNGYTTTLLFEVLTQRNFVADFKKKQKNSLFKPPFGGLRGNVRTPSIAHWKANGRLSVCHN